MKKLIVFAAMMLICFGIKAIAGNENDCYLKAGDKFYIGTDLKIGPVQTKIIFADGSFLKVNNREITAYKHHDVQYMLMPVICEKNDTLCMAMMKYITSRSGHSVYQYCCPSSGDVFFEYKDGKFFRRLDAASAKEELSQLGIEVQSR